MSTGVFHILLAGRIRQGIASAAEDEISLGQAFGFAFKRWRVFIAHYSGFALLALPMTTLAPWVPSYLIRVVGLSPPETGFKLGLIVLIFSTPVPSSLNYDATNGVGGVFGDSIEYPPSLKLWRDKLSIVYCNSIDPILPE